MLTRAELDWQGRPMRWDRLIDDLEAQAAALEVRERQVEATDRTRRELARAALLDRFRAAVGAAITIYPDTGDPVHGRLSRVGAGWVLVTDGLSEQVIATEHVGSVSGLPVALEAPLSDAQRRVHRGLDLAYLLRGMAADRSYLRLTLRGEAIAGTIDRVGADFFDLAVHPAGEQRRAGSVREVRTVLTAAVVAVRRMEA